MPAVTENHGINQPIEPPCSFMRETSGVCRGASVNNVMMEQCKDCEYLVKTQNKGCYNCKYNGGGPITCGYCRDMGEITGFLHGKWEKQLKDKE